MLKSFVFLILNSKMMITYQQEVPMLPRPSIYHTKTDQNTLFIDWYPLESDKTNPIIGYKVKVWEIKTFKTHRIKGEIGIIENQEIDYERVQDFPDYEPVLYKVIPGGGASSASLEGLVRRVDYQVRVQAYSAAGDGPWSAALAWRDGPSTEISIEFLDETLLR